MGWLQNRNRGREGGRRNKHSLAFDQLDARCLLSTVAGNLVPHHAAETVAVVRHRRARKSGRRALTRRSKTGDNVLATRSFLVDVHFLGRD